MKNLLILTPIFLFLSCIGNGVVNGDLMNVGPTYGGLHVKNVSITQGYIEVDLGGNLQDNNSAYHLSLRYVDNNNNYGCVLYDADNNGTIEMFSGGTEGGTTFNSGAGASGLNVGVDLTGTTFGCEIVGGVVNSYVNRTLINSYTIGADGNDNVAVTAGSYGPGISDSGRGGSETAIIRAIRFYSARPFP